MTKSFRTLSDVEICLADKQISNLTRTCAQRNEVEADLNRLKRYENERKWIMRDVEGRGKGNGRNTRKNLRTKKSTDES